MHGCRDGSKYRTYSHFAVAILAEQNAGFALLDNRKLLLCSVTSPRIALAILAEQNAGFALFYGKDPTFLQIDIEKRAGT